MADQHAALTKAIRAGCGSSTCHWPSCQNSVACRVGLAQVVTRAFDAVLRDPDDETVKVMLRAMWSYGTQRVIGGVHNPGAWTEVLDRKNGALVSKHENYFDAEREKNRLNMRAALQALGELMGGGG